MQIPITMIIRCLYTVKGVASSNPVPVPCFVFDIIYIFFIYRYSCFNIIHIHYQIIWAAELCFNDSKQCMPYLVDAFRGISQFANVPIT